MKYVEEWIREEIEYNNKMYEQAPIERERIRQEYLDLVDYTNQLEG